MGTKSEPETPQNVYNHTARWDGSEHSISTTSMKFYLQGCTSLVD